MPTRSVLLAIALILAGAPVGSAAVTTADPCKGAQPQDCVESASEEADDPIGVSLERWAGCVWVLLVPCVEDDAAKAHDSVEKNKQRALGLVASYWAGVCGDQEPVECIQEGPSWPICIESYCVSVDPS